MSAKAKLLAGAFALALPCIAGAAERIVTVAPSLTELVCAVGACNKLVGVDQHSDYPESAKNIARIGDAFSVNLETILALKPDLILAWDGGTDRQRMNRLQQLGLRVEWIHVGRLDEIANALIRVGQLAGPSFEKTAALAASRYRSRLDQLRAYTYPEPRPGVLYQLDTEPIYTVNRESPISEAIELCGGRNIFADLSQLAGIVSVESVLARNPAVILFPDEVDTETIKQQWRRWPMLQAVKLNALYGINDSLLARASPRMIDGIEQLCAVLDQVRKKQ